MNSRLIQSNLQPNAMAAKIEVALQQHNLAVLFAKHLEWTPLSVQPSTLPSLTAVQSYIPIAYKSGTVAWRVQLDKEVLLTSSLKEQLYRAIEKNLLAENKTFKEEVKQSPPLVIFVDSQANRSLWCQAAQRQASIESALYISSQPIALWRYKLERLKKGQSLLRSHSSQAYSSFKRLLESTSKATTGISNLADRQNYALITLQRLIIIQSIQQKGWMDNDTWYLQTRFEAASATQQPFFSTYLQPLYQCLALPAVERPAVWNGRSLPFLGHLFHTHRLEQKYKDIQIDNCAFEQVLGWLSEQAIANELNPWSGSSLSGYLETYLQEWLNEDREDSSKSLSLASSISTQILSHLIANRLKTDEKASNINDFLFNADDKVCRYLAESVLPNLRILDPACGSGNLLVSVYQDLTEIFCNLIGYKQQNQNAQTKAWRIELSEDIERHQNSQSPTGLLQAIQTHFLKNNLYGVDISIQAVEATIFQLSLHTISTAEHRQDIEPLVDLSFNVLVGNSLIGLIDVDSERFERSQKSSSSSVMQGDLLQPLVADSYQTILSEKNLAVEHYKFRNQMLANARNIPDYARAALLKEDILRLDIKAQQKLDRLLLNQMSQQLGIQYKAAQLDRKPQRRPLTLEDIDILQPFHWGYHFNTIIEQGGFDIIVCMPPRATFKPTATEFLQKFQDLAAAKGINARSLKTSKQALSQSDPEIAQAWLFYQDQYAYVADYFYRSEQYEHQNPKVAGKTTRNQLSRERLFVERAFNLLSRQSICAIVLSEALSKQPKSQALNSFLQREASVVERDIKPSQDSETILIIWKPPPAASTHPKVSS